MPDGDLCTMNLKEGFAPGMGFFLHLGAFRTSIDTKSLGALHHALLSGEDIKCFSKPMSMAASHHDCSPVVSQSSVEAEVAIPGDVVDASSQVQQVSEVSASLYASASRFAAALSNMAQPPVSSQQLPILPLTGIEPSRSLDLPLKRLAVRLPSLQTSKQRRRAEGANPPRVTTRSRLQGIRPLQDEQVTWASSPSQGGQTGVFPGKPVAMGKDPEGEDDAVALGPSLGEATPVSRDDHGLGEETPTFRDDDGLGEEMPAFRDENGLDMLCAAAAMEDGAVNVPVVIEADLQRVSGGILKRERWWEPQRGSEPKKRRVTLAPGPLNTTPDGHPERETRTSRAPRPRHEGFTLSQVTKASVRVLEAELGTSDEYLPSINRLKRKVGLLPHLRREFPYRTAPSKSKNPNKASGVQTPGMQKVTRRPINAQALSNKDLLLTLSALQYGASPALDPKSLPEFDCSLPNRPQPVIPASEITEQSAAGSEQLSEAQSSRRMLRDFRGPHGVTDSSRSKAGNVTGQFPMTAGPTRLVSHGEKTAPASLVQT